MHNLKEYNSDVAQCGYVLDYETGESFYEGCANEPIVFDNKIKIKERLLSDTVFCVNIWNKLYKAKHIKKIFFDEDIPNGEDWKFNFDILEYVNTIVCFDMPKYHYCIRNTSATRDISAKSVLTAIRIFEYFYERIKEDSNLLPSLSRGYLKQATNSINTCIRSRKTNTKEFKMVCEILKKRKDLLLRYANGKTSRIKVVLMCNYMWLYIIYMRFIMFSKK